MISIDRAINNGSYVKLFKEEKQDKTTKSLKLVLATL